ncbi:MAG TPA: YncE family protein [Puia sp.]|nr:YncE family protein [Puia sp.]
MRNSLILLFAGISFFSVRSQQYVLDKKIPVPGDGGYDYVAIDQVNHHLFASHGTEFNVIDLVTEKPVGVVQGLKGVHGIAIVNEVNKGFISDGRGQAVVVIDLKTFQIIKTISLAATDEDGIIYDPYSKKVFVFNGDSKSTCAIDIKTLELVKTIDLGGSPEFAASNGMGLVYNNIEDQNSLKVIDTKALEVKATYPLAPCGKPTGLAFDAVHNRIFTGCRDNKGLSVLDAASGKVITTLPIGAGVDAVCYDPGSSLIFCSCGDATTTIIKQDGADSYQVIQTLATQVRAKTMALDPQTHKIYLSVASYENGTRNIVPGTFTILVYKMQ